MTSVNVTTTKNTVTVNGETRVVTVKTVGPQGPAFANGTYGDIVVSNDGADLNIDTGAIVNADINDSAAIDGSKINPNFGSQNISTTGTLGTDDITITGDSPAVVFTDNAGTVNDPDYKMQNNNGRFILHDNTNNVTRFLVKSDGTVDIAGNLDVNAGLDVTGIITGTSHIDLPDDASLKLGDNDEFQIFHNSSNSNSIIRETGGGILSLQTNGNQIDFWDYDNQQLMAQFATGGACTFRHGATTRLATSSTGINVIGDISVSGTVDSVNLSTYQADGGSYLRSDADDSFSGTLTANSDGVNPVIKVQGIGPNYIRFATDAGGTVDADSIDLVYRATPNTLNFERASDSQIMFSVDADTQQAIFNGNVDCNSGLDVSGGDITGTLGSGVTGTTQSASDNSTKIATTSYVDTAVSNLVNEAPNTLDTLNELAAALGDNPNFATTVTNSIGDKLPLAGGTLTGDLNINGNLGLSNDITLLNDKVLRLGELSDANGNQLGRLRISYSASNEAIMHCASGDFLLQSTGDIKLQTNVGGTTTDKLVVNSTSVNVSGNLDIDAGTLVLDTDPNSPTTDFGLQEAIRIDDAGNTVDRALNIYEYREGGGRFFTLNYNLASGSTGSAYTFTQGNYGSSSMIRFDGFIKFFVNAEVNANSQDVITPTKRFEINTTGVDVNGQIVSKSTTGTGDTGLKIDNSNETFVQYFEGGGADATFVMSYTGSGGTDIRFKHNGEITLNNAGQEKFKTTQAGVAVTGNLTLPDNGKIILGDDGETDSFITFNGDSLRIVETSPTGSLLLDGHNIFLRNSSQSNEGYLKCNGGSNDRNVELFCQGTQRLITNSTGVAVTGKATVTESAAIGDTNLRKITTSTSAPTSSDGSVGDIWIVYPS